MAQMKQIKFNEETLKKFKEALDVFMVNPKKGNAMLDKINTEQPLMLQPECVDCKLYDGFGQCLEHGNRLKDNCEDFRLIED